MSIRKLAGETAIYGVSSILSRLLNYVILTPYLTRVFIREEYGVVSELFFYAAILTVFFTYRMETTFFRFGSKSAESIEKAFSTAAISLLVSTLFFTGLLLFLSAPIAQFLTYPDNIEFVQIVILIVAFDALIAIPFARLRLENRPIKFAILKILHILINIVVIFFFLKYCPLWIENGVDFLSTIYSSENRILYIFIANLLASVVVFCLLLPSYLKMEWSFDIVYWKRMIWYALPLIVVGLAGIINSLGALPLLSNILPESVAENRAETGTYGATLKLAVLMSLFTQAFNYAAEPFFFRHSTSKGSKAMYGNVGFLFTLIGSVVFLGIMFYIDLIQLFLGKDFRSGLEIVPILLIANLFLGIYYNFSIWYKLADKTIWGAYISTGGALITISLNILLIPSLGMMGSAWATLCCYAFMALACYWSGQKYYAIPYPLAKMIRYILLAVGFYFMSLWLETQLLDNTFLVLGVNTFLLITYLALIYLIDGREIRKILLN